MQPNLRTGRVEVYGDNWRLVGSLPGKPTDEQIREMMKRLAAEEKART